MTSSKGTSRIGGSRLTTVVRESCSIEKALEPSASSPQEREQWETPVIASTEAIRKDLDALFPHDCMRIDFEFDSMGDALRPGKTSPAALSLTGSSSAHPSQTRFFLSTTLPCRADPGGNRAPRTNRYFTAQSASPSASQEMKTSRPGSPISGSTRRSSRRAGTSLAAYDASGHRIATVVTETGSHQFIGLRSNVLMHRVEIIPDQVRPRCDDRRPCLLHP